MDAPTRRLAQYHRPLNATRPCQSWHCDGNVGRSAWYVLSHASREAITMIGPESALRRTGCELSRPDCCTSCLDAATPVRIFINVPLTLPSRCTTLCNPCVHSLHVFALGRSLQPRAAASIDIQQGTQFWADVPVSLDRCLLVH
jgi:hypothetical protein